MKWHWYYVFGYIWIIPATMIGMLLALVYRPTSWRWSEGCIEAIGGDKIFGKPGAQTHGFLIYYKDTYNREISNLRVHERVHVFQAIVLGPLFILAYGLHFLVLYAFNRKNGWHYSYRRVWAEKQAYRIQDEFLQGKREEAWGSQR